MVAISALLALVLLQAPQEPEALGPTPPPDRYDDAYDARLFEAWRGYEIAIGPRDPLLPAQPPALRPKEWLVLEGDPSEAAARAIFLRDHVIRPLEMLPIKTDGDARTMPVEGELEGPFAHAFTRFEVETDEVRIVRAPGVELVFVNGEGFIGDPERCGWLGVPVAMKRGANEILAVGIRDGFEVDLWKPATRLVRASWSLEVGQMFGGPKERWPDPQDELYVPILNASLQPAEAICFHYDRAYSAGVPPSDLGEWSCGEHAAPLALARGSVFLFDPDDVPSGPLLLSPVAAFLVDGSHGDRRLLPLRTDRPRPSWPAPVNRTWPPNVPDLWPSLHGWPILIHERTGSADFDANVLAVARFCQQRLWERSGILASLYSQEAFSVRFQNPRLTRKVIGPVIRFGRLDGETESVLYAGPDVTPTGVDFAIRGSDLAGMRLAYAIEPFFRAVDSGGETWSLP